MVHSVAQDEEEVADYAKSWRKRPGRLTTNASGNPKQLAAHIRYPISSRGIMSACLDTDACHLAATKQITPEQEGEWIDVTQVDLRLATYGPPRTPEDGENEVEYCVIIHRDIQSRSCKQRQGTKGEKGVEGEGDPFGCTHRSS